MKFKIIIILILILILVPSFIVVNFGKNVRPKIYPNAEIVEGKSNFKTNDAIKFTVSLHEKPQKSGFIIGKQVYADDKPVKATVSNPWRGKIDSNLISVSSKDGENYDIEMSKNSSVHPGLFTLNVILSKDGQTRNIQQDFRYGVLAINTNKSIYTSGDDAYLQIAALTDAGHTLCSAKLELTVVAPNGSKENYSTNAKSIINSSTCAMDNVTDSPDYYLHVKTGGAGTYTMTLKNLDTQAQITDAFEVRDSVPFVIERIGATRINPFKAAYTMHIKVTANKDYKGEVDEEVPVSFEVKGQNAKVKSLNQNSKIVYWDVGLNRGESVDLEYTYQSPKISPEFFLLGPLSMYPRSSATNQRESIFSEARFWQIASDATCTSTATGGNWATGGTWVAGCTGTGGVPGSADTVVIATTGGNKVTGNSTTSVLSITINANAILDFTSQTPTVTLTNTTGTLLTNNGTYTGGGETISTNRTISAAASITLNAGTWNSSNAVNNLTAQATDTSGAVRTFTVNQGADMYIKGTLTITSGGSKELTAYNTSGSNFALSAAFINVTNTNNTNTITANSSTITLFGTSGNLLTCAVAGSCSLASSTFHVTSPSGTSASMIFVAAATTVNNITIDAASGMNVALAPGGLTINGNLTINSGTATGDNTITGNATGTLTVGPGASLVVGSTTNAAIFPTNFTAAHISLDPTSTVKYGSSNAALTISTTPTYGNLQIMPGTTSTDTPASGTLQVNGDLTIGNGTNAATFAGNTNNPTINVAGDVTIAASSTLTSTSGTLTIGGSFLNSGTFTHNSGTVTFNDSSQTTTISGSSTFNNLTCTTPGKLFRFTAGTTQTVANLTLTGSSTTGQIDLFSTTPGTRWGIHWTSSYNSMFYLNVWDSDASSSPAPISVSNSVDHGNNVNWSFSNSPGTNTQINGGFKVNGGGFKVQTQ